MTRFSIAALAFALAGCSMLAPALAPKVSAEPVALKPGDYALDPNHAALLFKVGHLGFSKFVGRFERFDVSLDFNEADPASARVEATIDMASLDVANDDFAETLTGPRWFDAAAYPQTVFRSSAIEITGENTGRMTGDLTMHGVTNPIVMDVTFNAGGFDKLRGAYVVGLSAQTEVSRKAFGVDRFEILVSDKVELEIEAEFIRKR